MYQFSDERIIKCNKDIKKYRKPRDTPHKNNNKMIVWSITKCGNQKRLPHFVMKLQLKQPNKLHINQNAASKQNDIALCP